MTAINLVRRSDAIHLMTDGAAYDRNGIVKEIGTKVLLFPTLPAALAVRGAREFQINLGPLQNGGLGTFDDLLDFIPIGARVANDLAGTAQRRAEVVIAGWSTERNRPESYLLCNYAAPYATVDGELAEAEPFTLIECGPILCTVPPPSLCAEFGIDPHKIVPDEFDPIGQGMPLMEAQRRHKGDLPFFSIGGFIQCTTIYASGVDSRVLHRWPDEIGQPIRP